MKTKFIRILAVGTMAFVLASCGDTLTTSSETPTGTTTTSSGTTTTTAPANQSKANTVFNVLDGSYSSFKIDGISRKVSLITSINGFDDATITYSVDASLLNKTLTINEVPFELNGQDKISVETSDDSATLTVARFSDETTTYYAAFNATVTFTGDEHQYTTTFVTKLNPVAPAAPISSITKAGNYTVQGKVVGINTRSFIVNDGTAAILVYLNAKPSVNLGDLVEVTGGVSSYNGMFQFSSTNDPAADVSVISEGTFNVPEATPLTKEIVDGWASAKSFNTTDMKEYTWSATAGELSGYTTLNFDGSKVAIEPAYFDGSLLGLGDGFKFETGVTYNLKGYFNGYSTSNKYASILLTSAAEDTTKPSIKIKNEETNIDLSASNHTLQLDVETRNISPAPTITYTSSDEKVATVSDKGLVTALKIGKVTITATAGDVNATIDLVIYDSSESAQVTKISELVKGTAAAVKGKVLVRAGSNTLIYDGSAAVLVYGTTDLKVGDYVWVYGKPSAYNNALQFRTSDGVVKLPTPSKAIETPAATPLTTDIINGWNTGISSDAKLVGQTNIKLYSWSGEAKDVKSGKYTNQVFNLEGLKDNLDARYYSNDLKEKIEAGKSYDVQGYFLGKNGGNFIFIITSFTVKA